MLVTNSGVLVTNNGVLVTNNGVFVTNNGVLITLMTVCLCSIAAGLQVVSWVTDEEGGSHAGRVG